MSADVTKKLHPILLKTLTTNLSDSTKIDRYIDYLTNQVEIDNLNGIDQVNLLLFDYINLESLSSKLWQLIFDANVYKCLILTSKQTLEAIEICLKTLLDSKITEITEAVTNNKFKNLTKLNVYCVGKATAERFNHLVESVIKDPSVKVAEFFNHERFIVKQATNLNDEESPKHKQNALELSKLIIREYNESPGEDFSTYALYPCSSIRKDDLSNALVKANVSFDELNVYRTSYSQPGLARLKSILSNELISKQNIICLVFFSPSCVEAVFNNLGSDCVAEIILTNKECFKFISIGPSTGCKLAEYVDRGFYELNEPSPQALETVLKAF